MPYADPVKEKSYQAKYRKFNRSNNMEYLREYRRNNRNQIFDMMGNKCVCCGENDPIYFHIDHVKNDGHIDRPILEKKDKITSNFRKGKTYVKPFYLTIKQYLATPKRYQILCANCNWAKHKNGGKLYKPKNKKKVA